ncbi:MAG: MFS transporter [Coriobacteriales bacterium]|jgi:DHA3 family macrolide efflux protein-like MFS transporter|nr:MFS transporter [Coriobacteriales bacterium]
MMDNGELSAAGTVVPRHWRGIIGTIWSGQAVSILTSTAAGYALLWYLTETTGSALVLAFASLAVFVPGAILGPFAGAIVDRFDRKLIMIVADIGIAVVTVIAALLISMGATSIALVVGIQVVRSVGQTFHQPAMQAVMPLLVPDRHLVRIGSLDQGIMSVSNIGGPALGIFMYVTFGLQVALFADAAGALIACGALLLVSVPQAQMDKDKRSNVLHEMGDGLRAIGECEGMGLLFLFIFLGTIAFMPMAMLYPLMTYEHFALGGFEASLVEAVFGIGLLLGSIVLGIWGGGRKLVWLVALSIGGCGIVSIACGLLPPAAFSSFVVFSGVMAVAMAFFNGPLAALIQRRIAPEKLGRVMALLGVVFSVASPIGLLVAGPVAEALGVAPWFVISGVGMVAVAIAALIPPSVRSLDKPAGE